METFNGYNLPKEYLKDPAPIPDLLKSFPHLTVDKVNYVKMFGSWNEMNGPYVVGNVSDDLSSELDKLWEEKLTI